MEQVNEEWQQYAEQRDQYVRVLVQRYGELEQLHSRCSILTGALTDEQQRKIDRLLLDQRHKTELAVEAQSQVRAPCVCYSSPHRMVQAMNSLPTADCFLLFYLSCQ